MKRAYDFIFAGGGMSALLLAWNLLRQAGSRMPSMLIIDPHLYNYPLRNICFWATEKPDLPIEYKGIWPQAFFAGPKGEKLCSIAPYRYYCFELSILMNSLLQELSKQSQIEFIKGRVNRIEGGSIYTDVAELAFEAKHYVFDSVPPANLPKALLWQHFLGWEIECETDAFDTDSFRLMDFRVSQSEGPAFMYLLPFNARSALIEFTLMSPEVLPDSVYEAHLANYMERYFGGFHYRITDKEKGQIPMAMEIQGLSTAHYHAIGTRGGFTKPTTGYTFMNVWRHAQLVAREIAAGKALTHQANASRYQFYDRLLLNIMKRSPHEVAPIMEKLFLGNSFSNILSFISEASSPLQEMQIFGSLPWMPFFRAIAHEYFFKQGRTSS